MSIVEQVKQNLNESLITDAFNNYVQNESTITYHQFKFLCENAGYQPPSFDYFHKLLDTHQYLFNEMQNDGIQHWEVTRQDPSAQAMGKNTQNGEQSVCPQCSYPMSENVCEECGYVGQPVPNGQVNFQQKNADVVHHANVDEPIGPNSKPIPLPTLGFENVELMNNKLSYLSEQYDAELVNYIAEDNSMIPTLEFKDYRIMFCKDGIKIENT